jgi:diaminopimelate epimerase
MMIEFTKMAAQGNDYIYIDNRTDEIKLRESERSRLARQLSERHFGIGSDGVVWLVKSMIADCGMLMYNADGSRGTMCGSALRCVVYLLFKENNRIENTVQTDSGIRIGWCEPKSEVVKVTMGKVENFKQAGEKEYIVDAGNRHLVRFVDDLELIDLSQQVKTGRILEGSGFNYEYAQISDNSIKLKIYERGSGITLACGTGAVAAAYAGWRSGRLNKKAVTVKMPGGEVQIELREKEIYLTGQVKEVYWGRIEI